MIDHRVAPAIDSPRRPTSGSGSSGVAAASGDPLWDRFGTAYTAALGDAQRDGAPPHDQVAECAVELVAAAPKTPPRTSRAHHAHSAPARTHRPAQVEGRARRLVTKLAVAFATEPGGFPACLARAERWDGFDWLRDRLEHHGFTRVVAWRLCLAFRRAGLLHAQPNRPYLDRRGVEVTQSLLAGTGVRAHSVRDWESALMLEVDSRLASGAHPAKLDAEIVAAACARLAGRAARSRAADPDERKKNA